MEHADNEELGDVGRILMKFAVDIPWIDDEFAILVLDNIPKPYIVMDIEKYIELEKRIVGNG